jgi:DNA-binding response OmpR family regulator
VLNYITLIRIDLTEPVSDRPLALICRNELRTLMTEQHVAVVDDEPGITRLLATYLAGQGFRVTELSRGSALEDLMRTDPPDLVLLDIGLAGEDGLVIARRLREHWSTSIILVTGRCDPVDKVVGLEIGADDYVTKPFDLRELLARIKAVLRRSSLDASPTLGSGEKTRQTAAPGATKGGRYRFDGWLLEMTGRRLFNPSGKEVNLTTGEFNLLLVFLAHGGRVLSRDFLLGSSCGRESAPFDRAVDVLVSRLRKKIEANPGRPEILKSVRGAGYLFVPLVRAD